MPGAVQMPVVPQMAYRHVEPRAAAVTAEQIMAEVATEHGTTVQIIQSYWFAHKLRDARAKTAQRLKDDGGFSENKIALLMRRDRQTIRGYLHPERRLYNIMKIRNHRYQHVD